MSFLNARQQPAATAREADDDSIRISVGATASEIELRIEDNGCGISVPDRDHVFEPFFTTKDPDQGTGLGLAVCRDLVEGIGGTIGVESSPGKGTTMIIKLPV